MSKHASLVLALALLTSGCATYHGTRHPHGMPPGQAKKLAHSHGNGCGHVHVGGEWVLTTSHKSKPGKGRKK